MNAVDEKTIRSVLKDFECPNEPTIIKGRIGTPDCDGSKVCSIAKASLRDMKITKEECEKLKSALMKPDPARQRVLRIPSAQSFRFPIVWTNLLIRPVIAMVNRALSRRIGMDMDDIREGRIPRQRETEHGRLSDVWKNIFIMNIERNSDDKRTSDTRGRATTRGGATTYFASIFDTNLCRFLSSTDTRMLCPI